MGRSRISSRFLWHLGRLGRKSVQAHAWSKGQRQSSSRPWRNARSLRLIANGNTCCRHLSLHFAAFRITYSKEVNTYKQKGQKVKECLPFTFCPFYLYFSFLFYLSAFFYITFLLRFQTHQPPLRSEPDVPPRLLFQLPP